MTPPHHRQPAPRSQGGTLTRVWRQIRRRRLLARVERLSVGDRVRYTRARWAGGRR